MTPRSRLPAMVLILVFAVGRTAAARQAPTLPIAPKQLQNRPTNIVLRLTEAGTPVINNQAVQWARLGIELQAIFGRRPEKILFMTTSPQDKVQDVRRVVAIARRRGVQVFALPRSAALE